MIYNRNLTIYQNTKSNIVTKNLAISRWGNKFKKLFNKHLETIYSDYPAYNFTEGMKDCTNASGSTQDRLDDAKEFKNSLISIGSGEFTATVRNTTIRHKIYTENDITIDIIEFSKVKEFNVNTKFWIKEVILEKELFDFDKHPFYGEIDILNIDITIVMEYLNSEIERLKNYTIDNIRANDDIELINHLGLCDTLSKEIDRPHYIKKIWFRFKKKVSPPFLKDNNGVIVGYDSNYKWWEEKQFKEISKKVKNFKEYCSFEVAEYDENGVIGNSFVFLKIDFLSLSGMKIFWFVKAFLDVGVKTKSNLFRQIFGAILLVISLYLTAVSSNPTFLKVALIIATIASYSGHLSKDAQFALTILTFAYNTYNTDFSSMSTLEMYQWAFENIDVVLQTISYYQKDNLSTHNEKQQYEEQQDRAISFIYDDSYDLYKIYNEMYEDMISVDVGI